MSRKIRVGAHLKFKPQEQIAEPTRNWARDYGWDLVGLRGEVVRVAEGTIIQAVIAVTSYGNTRATTVATNRRIHNGHVYGDIVDLMPISSLFTVKRSGVDSDAVRCGVEVNVALTEEGK